MTHRTATITEEDMEDFPCFLIDDRLHRRAKALPSFDGFSSRAMNRFCVASAGLVCRYIDQANGQAVLYLCPVFGLLPSNAADSEARDFILSQAGKEPYDS